MSNFFVTNNQDLSSFLQNAYRNLLQKKHYKGLIMLTKTLKIALDFYVK